MADKFLTSNNPNGLTDSQVKAGYSTIPGSFDPLTGKAKSGSSSVSNVVNYDAKTGAKLAPGATTTDALGNVFTQGSQFNPTKTIAPTDINSTTQNIPTFQPTQFDAIGNLVGSQAATDYYNNVTAQQANVDKQSKDTQQMYKDLFASISSPEQQLSSAKQASGMDKAQKLANDENAKLQAIIKQGQANQLSVVGQGRGIPEAIIGGQQAQFARETAIQALPVQASLEAAQGNLAAATATFDKLFQAKQQDAQNKLSYGFKVIDTISQFASEKDKIALDYVKMQEQRKYAIEDSNRSTINELIKSSSPFGLTSDVATRVSNLDMTKPDSIAQASSLLSPFLSKANRELKSVGDNLYMYDKNTNKLTLVGGQGGGSSDNISNPAYSGIVDTILASGKFTKDQAIAVRKGISNGEDPFTVIKNNAKGIMDSTTSNKLSQAEVARDAFNDFSRSLQEYYDAGGSTNIVKGNFEKAINKLGEVKDPKLVSLATQLQATIQTYRNAISGTAYSVQESKDINSIFPGIDKTQGLNEAIISGRNKAFNSTIDGYYGSALGKDTYNKLKNLEESKNNIPKNGLDDKSYVEKILTSQNIKYDEFVNNVPYGQIPVIDNSTGQVGYIPYTEFTSSKFTKI